MAETVTNRGKYLMVNGAVTVALTPAELTVAAVAVTPVPGPVTVTLTPATLTLTARPLGVSTVRAAAAAHHSGPQTGSHHGGGHRGVHIH